MRSQFKPFCMDEVHMDLIETITRWYATGCPHTFRGRPLDGGIRHGISTHLGTDGEWEPFAEKWRLVGGRWGFPERLGYPLVVLRDLLNDLSTED